jgi:hypothetical protein
VEIEVLARRLHDRCWNEMAKALEGVPETGRMEADWERETVRKLWIGVAEEATECLTRP